MAREILPLTVINEVMHGCCIYFFAVIREKGLVNL